MEHMLKPAGAEGVAQALMPLMLTTVMPNMEGMTDETQQSYFQSKSSEYARLLGGLPVDILSEACDEHVRRSKFFPAIAELMEFAGPKLAHRQRQASRIKLLIAGGGQEPAAPPKPMTDEERLEERKRRLRQTRDTWVRLNRPHHAKRAEQELAELEGREADSELVRAEPPPVEMSRPIDANRERMKQEVHDSYRSLHERGMLTIEEPPPSDEIPE